MEAESTAAGKAADDEGKAAKSADGGGKRGTRQMVEDAAKSGVSQAVEKVQGIMWHFIFCVVDLVSQFKKIDLKRNGCQVLSRKMDNLQPFVKNRVFQRPENGTISLDTSIR
ncbi:hypothetical protein L3476_01670 [Paenibacillus thiaminolyticus]|uniref:hypothetical protein n=1 Tax=Paenibacillus thiaminolyticus TaxID=49283 RepID=UPI0011629FB3|nr:hypothetical protein [Paenibacillus thiaminolyticus]NGP57291.1 hypothetical protein [Paenibacillus thiaminolyticus]WCR27515.1 hypothetical protein L3476_01670 [Paenibacillus thiaminolyticus]